MENKIPSNPFSFENDKIFIQFKNGWGIMGVSISKDKLSVCGYHTANEWHIFENGCTAKVMTCDELVDFMILIRSK